MKRPALVLPLAAFVLPLAALAAALPLFLHGASCGHDFVFHTENWMETAQQWTHGTLLPRWDFHAAWGAGEPRFLFYPPLSWILGALLGLALPWKIVPAAFTFLALLLCGITLYRAARTRASEGAALLAACIYLANPYMLFVAYERTAYAELLAAAWMPLLLLEALRPRLRVSHIAFAIALLWLTNAPAAVLSCYLFALLIVLRAILAFRQDRQECKHLCLRASVGVLLGMGAAGFYLIPAIYERRFVQIQMAIIETTRPWKNFLFTHNGNAFHDAVLWHASIATVAVLAVAIVCIASLLLRRSFRQDAQLLAAATAAIVLLLLPASAFAWKLLPQMVFLQFPWRLTSIAGAISALLLALALPNSKKLLWPLLVCGVLFAFAAGSVANTYFRQACDDEDAITAHRAAFLHGERTEPTDEYTILDADNDALAHNNPRFWLAKDVDTAERDGQQTNIFSLLTSDPYQYSLTTLPSGANYLVLNLRRFHGWHIRVNGSLDPTLPQRNDGLTAVPLPADGIARVDVFYRRTPDQYTGWALTVLCVLLLIVLREHEALAASRSAAASCAS